MRGRKTSQETVRNPGEAMGAVTSRMKREGDCRVHSKEKGPREVKEDVTGKDDP